MAEGHPSGSAVIQVAVVSEWADRASSPGVARLSACGGAGRDPVLVGVDEDALDRCKHIPIAVGPVDEREARKLGPFAGLILSEPNELR